MNNYPFWQRQEPDKPLFPDVEWNKPEQKQLRGRLGVIGGNKLGFAGVAEAYATAQDSGAGEIRVLLPDILRKTIPKTITDAVYAPNNISGSLSRDALTEMEAIGVWSSGILLVGDAGRSSETAIVYDDFVRGYSGWLTLTRDSIDLLRESHSQLVEREQTLFVASFAQLQKLFQSVYYPKVLTFSMQLAQLVDALHKFTLTYPITILTLHKDHIITAHHGDVISMQWDSPTAIWRGRTATRAATYLLWGGSEPLKSVVTSLYTP